MNRILAILGSAETTPTMIKPHRAMFDRVGDAPAVLLDTPYGFQENADDISARAIEYFAQSVGRRVDVATLRSPDDALAVETAMTRIRQAGWVFAGPGSPSFALRVWASTSLGSLLADKVREGGAVVFSSAAALTLGCSAVPVYEIYKAGSEPFWLPGLDLLEAATGLKAAVIPHYDNAEGGHHDTRFCYLGERRLRLMEALLPDGAFVLGVDEHTGLILDLDGGSASVVGLGSVTVRSNGDAVTFSAGTEMAIDSLRPGSPRTSAVSVAATATVTSPSKTPLLDEAHRLDAVFSDALAARDAAAATAASLELEQVVHAWSGDNAATDEPDRARVILRSMIVRLGEAAVAGVVDRRDILGPVVSIVMAERAAARSRNDWTTSDRLRDALGVAGIEVRDRRDGADWVLQSDG